MNEKIDRSVWINYFDEFTRRNQSRVTRLEVLGELGAQEEECGLTLGGISLERGNGLPAIEIILDGPNGDTDRHLTHFIENVVKITPKRGLDGRDEALEIVDRDGERNLLTFQSSDVSLEPRDMELL